jgi:hypothetical protein
MVIEFGVVGLVISIHETQTNFGVPKVDIGFMKMTLDYYSHVNIVEKCHVHVMLLHENRGMHKLLMHRHKQRCKGNLRLSSLYITIHLHHSLKNLYLLSHHLSRPAIHLLYLQKIKLFSIIVGKG